jgi:hypothetical protein
VLVAVSAFLDGYPFRHTGRRPQCALDWIRALCEQDDETVGASSRLGWNGAVVWGISRGTSDTFAATTVGYPADKVLSYSELRPFVNAAVPKVEPFVLLAESFSTPLALEFAASNPPNLTAVVICAGFVFKPIADWPQLAKAVAQPWLFRLSVPRCILEYFLVGRDAPRSLIQELRQVLRFVSPQVLSGRV